jgi:hypothetical protein
LLTIYSLLFNTESREEKMGNMIERLITEPVQGFLEKIIAFLPNLFSAMLILLFGFFAGWFTRYILSRLFKFFKLDEFSERAGIKSVILKGGIRETFSGIIAKLAGWLAFFAFIIIALGSLNVPAIERLLERFFLYLPNVFVAIVIVILGYMLSNFFGRAALIASVNAGLKMSGLVGKAVKLSIFIFSLSIALEQLGIGRDTVIIAFAILFGGIVLAFAIAFGLGGRDAAKSYIERKLIKEEEKDDITHI